MVLKKIDGIVICDLGVVRTGVVARCTSDSLGETLSLESKGVQISVDYKTIEAMMNKERKKR